MQHIFDVDIVSLLSTDGYIMCNKKIIKLYGSDSAVLLGELCAEYNFYKNAGQLSEDDTFYSTQSNIEENTGLNPHAQRKALKILEEEEIIHVYKKGLPAKNFYWINENKLLKIFSTSHSNFEQLDVQNMNINNNNINNNKNNNIGDYDAFFNSLWSMYPKKKGKGSVSKSQKKKLMSIGLETLSTCIDRYKKEIEGKDTQYVMYGSTFFNSGYVDYLDENYQMSNDTYVETNLSHTEGGRQ